jgi:hypothetical protein
MSNISPLNPATIPPAVSSSKTSNMMRKYSSIYSVLVCFEQNTSITMQAPNWNFPHSMWPPIKMLLHPLHSKSFAKPSLLNSKQPVSIQTTLDTLSCSLLPYKFHCIHNAAQLE